MSKKTRATIGDVEDAKNTLERANRFLQNGGLLQITVHKVSQSNMNYTFSIKVFYISKDGLVEDLYLNWAYGILMGYRQNNRHELKGNDLGTHRGFLHADNMKALFARHGLPEFLPRYISTF